MIKNIVIFVLVVMIFGGCKLPKQPAITSKEQSFFKKIENQYQCKVTREISPDYLRKLTPNASYLLQLDNLSCELLDSANLESKAQNIAADLFNNSLEKDSLYNSITIVFSCNTGKDQIKTKSFDYKTSSL